MTFTDNQQRLTPGLVGLSTHTDCVYLQALHSSTARGASSKGVSRLKLLYSSLNFEELVENTRTDRWSAAEQQIADAARALQAGGADFLLICANTAYALTERTREQVPLPILDIAEPVCRAIRSAGLRTPGLLSTLKTEESGLYQRCAETFGLRVVSPSFDLAQSIQRLILEELIGGHVSDRGLQLMRSAAAWFAEHGADSLILGCTDLTHLVAHLEQGGPVDLPLFDSTCLHASAAAELALFGEREGGVRLERPVR